MRRISLALALVGAVAAAGCGGGTNQSASGVNKGVPGSTYTLSINPGHTVTGGKVQTGTLAGATFTPDGKIDCGTVAGVTTALCQADFAWGTAGLVIRATADTATGNNYFAFAGDCFGTGDCTLDGNADKMVLVRFAASLVALGTHPNFSDPAQHGPQAFLLNCTQCHGSTLAGQGIAPACSYCHTPAHIQSQLKTGLNVVINSVSTTTPITVQFTMKDDAGLNVDPTGLNSGVGFSANRNQPMAVTIALAYFGADTSGNYLNFASSTAGTPATVSAVSNTTTGTKTAGFTQHGNLCTVAAPCVCSSKDPCATYPLTAANGTLTFNAGVYTYVFQNPATGALTAAFPDPATNTGATNATVWIATNREENLTNFYDASKYTAVNADYAFVTPGYTGTAVQRAIVEEANCAKCHDGFPNESTFDANGVATSFSAFHSGARMNPRYCNMCHYVDRGLPGRTFTDGGADSKAFVHRIHSAEQFEISATGNKFHGIAVTYPQDVRNCRECHPDTAQGNQYKTRPTRGACMGCHFNVVFTADPVAVTSVAHAGGVQANDAACAGCHSAAAIDGYHVAVLPPDPNSTYAGGTNANTNAGYIAAAGAVVPGADSWTWVIGTVSRNASKRPVISFKLQQNGSDVVFDPCGANSVATTNQLLSGYVGSPSVYWVWAAPQDGINAPADFNASTSAYVKTVCNNNSTTAGANASITGPDGSGFYTITVNNVVVSDASTMLTGGVGYTYSLSSTQPLTQINLAAYPYNAANKTGGLVVTTPNVSKVATGYAGRRTVVASGRCNNCHAQLGVGPTFHAGQRNDAGSCSWCHNPNRTSSAWSANAKDFIHGIHGAKKRTVPFNWHAACPTGTTFTPTAGTNSGTCVDNVTSAVVPADPSFANVEFPGSKCTDCHEAGTYDGSAAGFAAVVSNLLPSTATTGTPAAAISESPYVTLGTAYGSGWSYAAATGVVTQAAATTLITSPIAAACFGCHTSTSATTHITTMGGKIYQPRSTAFPYTENCFACHGKGGVVDVNNVH